MVRIVFDRLVVDGTVAWRIMLQYCASHGSFMANVYKLACPPCLGDGSEAEVYHFLVIFIFIFF